MKNIVDKILYLATLKSTIFVVIDGMPGGGKSTLTKYILHKIPAIKLVKMDSFFNPSINNDDFERLKEECLIPLKNNKIATFKVYSWEEHKLIDGEPIKPGGIILVEGISSMEKDLIDFYDYKIWVDCPPEVGLERVLTRDKAKYRELWINKWIPETIKYIEEQKPDKKADIVINYKDILKFNSSD